MKITATFARTPRDKATPPTTPRTGGAARSLALAYRINDLIERGLVADFTAAARLLGVSQPRLTHLMSMLLLAPQLQEALLLGTARIGDKALRRLARLPAWSEQLAAVANSSAVERHHAGQASRGRSSSVPQPSTRQSYDRDT